MEPIYTIFIGTLYTRSDFIFGHYERSEMTALTVISSMQTCDTREVI